MNLFYFGQKKLSVWLMIFSFVLILSACSGNQSSGDVSKNKDANTEKENQSLIIALGHGLDYLGVDPYGNGRENTVLRTVVFEPLALETSKGQFEGALAKSWSVNETGTEWTFNLREGVTFHDGTPFTSSAVLEAFNHYMEDPNFSRRAPIENIVAPDDYTVVFQLQKPFAPFLNLVGSYQCVIPSPNSFDEQGNLAKPIGTGPFALKSQSKEKVEFIAYDSHWREKPSIDELQVVYISDPATMVLALESGEVDLIGADGYGIPQAEIKRLQDNKDFTVVMNADSSSLEWVGFNSNTGPLQDVNVRKAINYALDRGQIAEFIYEGFATPAVGPIGFDESILWTDTSIQGYQYDLEKAKQLLAEAGWKDRNKDGFLVKDGQVLELTFLLEGTRTWKPTGEAIQNQLAELGIKVNLELRDNSVIRELVKKGQFNMVGLGSIGKSAADPYYFFQYYFTTRGSGTVLTNNEKMDQLVSDVVSTIDQDKRSEIYNEIQREVMDLAPGAFLLHPHRVTIMKKDISGWDFANTMDPLRFVYKLSRE
ncbi:ABC transporter substrate-binding protein [Schinkia azotoformans]|uniref:ABC transporter substrate-binding protein n=1 Tax=Schinkia azotoformans TaxID=1454 RepID=UPI002DB76E1A|nr:ABC transporter substrate-binding protein [Schinkia azotoformans]MEC1722199.1 ABC transporter substrate-binding protein [Schinkia azotoformans]MED4412439.1 ABC transporter substrate-binding protein [Schinkia azotoformans]